MLDLEVIDDPAIAAAALDPVRAQLLAALAEPASATSLAERVAMTRQKVNYHLRTLEEHGLIRLVEERPKRGFTERVMVASAKAYALSPDVLGASAAATDTIDRLSSRYLIAVAGRLIQDVSSLARSATKADKPIATLTIESTVCLATPKDRADFSKDLADAVATVSARYHDETSRGGRWHRLVIASHPQPPTPKEAKHHD